MDKVLRVYAEKKPDYAVRAKELYNEIREYLNIRTVTGVRVLVRYDVEHIGEDTYQKALGTVFSEPPVDFLYEGTFPAQEGDKVFSVEYLPGQFDQRADSAMQCVKLLNESEEPVIQSATTYVLSGGVSDEELAQIQAYCINPVDSRAAAEEKPETLASVYDDPADVLIFDGFQEMSEEELKKLYDFLGLAMTFRDFLHIQNYFKKEEKRDPSVTEIRVLDTYWSDHCRHTTFLTELKEVSFEDGYYRAPIEASYQRYLKGRETLYADRKGKHAEKVVSLMDLAVFAMKQLKADGKLDDMEVSDEINACSIIVPVEIDGKTEEWLVFFKNETHNHPTEIEPFGGAATCLGGAIRDPLSGRGYVYQAMRVTGAADPTAAIQDTLKGKLPQRKIVTGAAGGYSSYGNQIGLATGLVDEIYHPNYVAKRMEIGAVMGAAPRKNVIRETSDPGDIIILMGGRTGRDGCGGATGSSKAHTTESIATCGAEVQKGNAPTERKLQRLFRRAEVTKLIKKCNDFGAGGVSVAIGELADGLRVDLDKVPKKYAGLDGTELAISESQERMAVVVAAKDVEQMLDYAASENLEAVAVAEVTEEKRLVLVWRGKEIVNISRAFLDTNGARQETTAVVSMPKPEDNYFEKGASYPAAETLRRERKQEECGDAVSGAGTAGIQGKENNSTEGSTASGADAAEIPCNGCDSAESSAVLKSDGTAAVRCGEKNTGVREKWLAMLSDLNVCSKKGLVEMFDSSIGAATVTMPYGGRYQMTPVQTMVAKLPVLRGACDTVTMMSYGFDPYLSSWSPYHGAVYAVIFSVAKIVAAGGDYTKIRFTFQEYFRRLGSDPKRWGEPLAALLGAYEAQIRLGLPSIGGKDSMSGTFQDIDVPPTLVSFAVDIAKTSDVVTDELKETGSKLVKFSMKKDGFSLPDYEDFMAQMEKITKLAKSGAIRSMYALGAKGIAEAVSKMAFGNRFGVKVDAAAVSEQELFAPAYGEILAEVSAKDMEAVAVSGAAYTVVGEVTGEDGFVYGDVKVALEEALSAWSATLEKVFPTSSGVEKKTAQPKLYDARTVYTAKKKTAQPTVFIPVFPGTNCEYDTLRAFEAAGAKVNVVVFKNRGEADIRESVPAFEKAIREAQILMFPGGFSAGDEPDGSGKFIATAFRNARLTDAVNDLLKQRDGLVLGICNGFQAIIKLGLVPYGEIVPQQDDSPTLTRNSIGRHISKSVYTKVVTNKSPWLMKAELGGVYAIPASHGEGRFVANDAWLKRLAENGQIATQYVDMDGCPTMDEDFNPNASYWAIEGITSPDGRVLGKMAHSERRGDGVALNIYGEQNQHIFESGVSYFR